MFRGVLGEGALSRLPPLTTSYIGGLRPRHVTRRMHILVKKRFIMGRLTSKLPLIITVAPESCKVNRQFEVGDSKYVVTFDPLPHVT